jgi:hypothetical protein
MMSGNTAGFKGGAAYNRGTATLDGCTIGGKSAKYGGGIFNFGTETLSLDDCTISGNSAGTQGGGVYNDSTVVISECTISGNSSIGAGGGVLNTNTSAFYGCTISNNSAGTLGGGVYNGGAATLTDTIVAGNSGGDLSGGLVDGSYDLIGTGGSDGLGSSNNLLDVADPLLSPLGNYGGPTQTIALLPRSPAIGTGTTVSGITADQRGITLPGTDVDIGAFQSQGFTLTPVSGSTPQSTIVDTSFANPLAVTVTANDPLEPVAGSLIAFSIPSTVASASLSGATAVIGSNGMASVTVRASAIAGSYSVTASAGVASAPATFVLNNLLPELSFSGLSNPSITYGTADVTLSGTLADNSLVPNGETVAVTLNGVEQQATINDIGAFSTTFNTARLAVAGSPYTIGYDYTTDGTFPSASTTGMLTVTRATLTPVVTVSPKVYDGTTTATLTSESLLGVIGGDAVNLTGGEASFASKNAGTDQTVTVTGLNLEGTAAGNYQLASTTATTEATISPAPLKITATSDTKTYDGTTTATATPTVSGLISTDTVTGLIETFDTKDVGTGKTLTVTAYTVNNGNGGADYEVTTVRSTGTIIPATVSVSGLTADNKVYDGTTAAILDFNAAALVGVLPGDTVTLDTMDTTGTIASSQAGSNIPVAVSGLTLGGPQAPDYTLARQPSTTATIRPATATITLTASDSSAVYGQSISFFAIVTSLAATPVGSVTFSEDGDAIATVPLEVSGNATLTTTSLALGSQAITAAYNGDGDFLAEQSGSVSVSVMRAATRIALVSQPVLKKKKLIAIDLTAMIEPVAPAGGIPTGELTLDLLVKQKKKLATKKLAMTRVIGGEATLTLKPGQVLNKAIAIVYSGDLDYQSSSVSSMLTQNSLEALDRPMIVFLKRGRAPLGKAATVVRG